MWSAGTFPCQAPLPPQHQEPRARQAPPLAPLRLLNQERQGFYSNSNSEEHSVSS